MPVTPAPRGSAGPIELPPLPRLPVRPGLGATYRIQLQPEFGFWEAAAMVPDLARLGIETVYTSPVTDAVPGSTHGYDGTDPTRIRDELGGADGFAALVCACAEHDLGLCVDIVPNHLAADVRGQWWRAVLQSGPDGELAPVFDIDWDAGPPEARRKVSLPLLDHPLDEVLAGGSLRLQQGAEGELVLELNGVELPLAGPAAPDDDPAEVLAAQHYRLVEWRQRYRDYRRFFDIDGLVGLHVEHEEVFARTHALVVALAERGALSAVRVDHLDGLADPGAYLRRLEAAVGGIPIVIEKILTGDERLRTSWPVAGTTGYEVVDDLAGALSDPRGRARLVSASQAEGEASVEETVRDARLLVAAGLFGAELERSAHALGVDAKALIEVTTRLPVYRTYLDSGPVHPDDLAALHQACIDHLEIEEALTGAAPLPAVLHYQQTTGAITAKGVEDTAWYRLAGPLAYCEVGGDPSRDRSDGVERLHARAAARAAEGRGGLIPWTTHDTKRSGDVRARLYALTELAEAFESGLQRLRRLLDEDGSSAATPGWCFDTRVLAQLALATLPAAGSDPTLGERIGAAAVKGAREAKLRTTWTDPDAAYEKRLAGLAERLLAADAALVRAAFGELVGEVARLGAVNSLTAVVLRSSLPGVPDCYQADESWNLVLVDPDNRRPPDPAQLRNELSRLDLHEGEPAAAPVTSPERSSQLRRDWSDGKLKVLVTAACLRARRRAPAAFARIAGYAALHPAGEEAGSLLALARSGSDGSAAVAVVTRLAGRLHSAAGDLPTGDDFGETVVDLPGAAPLEYRDVLSGQMLRAEGGRLRVADVLSHLPVALLVSTG